MPHKTLCVEYLHADQFLKTFLPQLRQVSQSKLYYFDASPSAIALAKLFNASIERIDFQMHQMRNKDEACIYLDVRFKGLGHMQKLICEEYPSEIDSSKAPTLKPYLLKSPVCDYDFYGSMKHRQLWHALVLIDIAHARLSQIELYLYKRPFPKALIRYAHERGIKMYFLETGHSKPGLIKTTASVIAKLKPQAVLNILKKSNASSKPVIKNAQPARLMAEYYGQFNLDHPDRISDLFFMDPQGIGGGDIALVFNNRLDPVDEAKWQLLKNADIQPIARTIHSSLLEEDRVPIFRPTPISALELKIENLDSAWNPYVNSYKTSRNYWRDFFKTYNIKMTTSWYKYDATHMAMTDALAELGGISTIYQRSYEPNPSPYFAVGTDCVFGFSNVGYDLLRQSGSQFKYHIAVGYIGDNRFEHLRPMANQIRSQLIKNGAKRILVYFDENSIEDGRWFMGHAHMRENYAFWINALLKDSELGIVFKPKIPGTLRRRLGNVSELLDQALSTGRCYLFEEGTMHGSYPPAAAALAGDFAIQDCLWAGTAGLESALSGTKTLLLDLEGWPACPLYQFGSKVVFKSRQEAWDALTSHWKKPDPRLGEWSDYLRSLDPFQDGKASQRMSQCLKWMLEDLRAGLDRNAALSNAIERYQKQWGSQTVKASK